MNGAESLLRTLMAAGLDVCFANPGTTEMPMVRALDDVPGMRAVLCLFEGVCTGAADGYARMAEKPGLTLLHLGPGFANGIAYLHDARRARSPIVNVDRRPRHVAPRRRRAAHQRHRIAGASGLGLGPPQRIRRRRSPATRPTRWPRRHVLPGRIATLIVPHDCQLEPASERRGCPRYPGASARERRGDRAGRRRCFAARDRACCFSAATRLRERGLQAAARIAAATGCELMCETFPTRWERGAGTPAIERLPYFPDHGIAALSRFRSIVLAGARAPVSFFGYPGIPSYLISPEQQQATLATPEEDVAAALDAAADALDAPARVDRARRPSDAAAADGCAHARHAVGSRRGVDPRARDRDGREQHEHGAVPRRCRNRRRRIRC